MRLLKQNRARLLALGGIALLVGTLLANYIINRDLYSISYFDYDGSAEIMLARTMADNGEWVFSSHWYYSTEIRFLHNQLVMASLFRLINDALTVHLVATVLIGIFMALCAIFCFRSLTLSWAKACMAAALVISAFSTEWFNNVLGNCYYSFFIANIFLFAGLLLRFTQSEQAKTRRRLALCLWLLSVLLGMCGMRYAVIVFIPVCLAVFFQYKNEIYTVFKTVLRNKQPVTAAFKQQPVGIALLVAVACCMYAAGFGVYSLVLCKIFPVMSVGTLGFSTPADMPEKFMDMFASVVNLLAPGYNLTIISFNGLLHVFKLFGAGILLICFGMLWRRRGTLPAAVALYIRLAAATLFVSVLANLFTRTLFGTGGSVSDRYMLLAIFLLLPAPVIWLHTARIPFVEKAFYTAVVALLLLVNPFTTYRILSTMPETSGTPAHYNNEVFEVVDALRDRGYTSGYTDFHLEGIINAYTNGEMPTMAVNAAGDTIVPFAWLQAKESVQIADMEGPQFFILFKFAYEPYRETLDALEGDIEVIYTTPNIIAIEFTQSEQLDW